ncbi:hypothetical protein CALVIDRAFT_564307 [Calocera viscosa TUFC12733]|uniref:Uncharacterized protein n=1 Tax=Calocera viscosa (strain TUFC12733) TaxID=1330018 RepID=A0A167LU80_CALVF|nr:hypothetical protein CALVIDRAFT_564307 [Calocera viscosa TUFC12733]
MPIAKQSSPTESVLRFCSDLGMENWPVEKLEAFKELILAASALHDNTSPPSSTSSTLSSSYMATPQQSPNSGTSALPPSSPIVQHFQRLEARIETVERRQLEPGSSKRRTRPTKVREDSAEGDSDQPAPKRTRGGVGTLKRGQLDEAEVRVRQYLLTQVREQLHAIIGYTHDGIMPSKGGPHLAEDAESHMEPDFTQSISSQNNLSIMARAARVVQEQEQANPDCPIGESLREQWLGEATLLDIARAVWPGLKEIWRAQLQREVDDGAAEKRKGSAGRRTERRKTRAGQLRLALEPFCEEHELDEEAVKRDLVYEDWVGDDWSCDEDGEKSQEWRDLLFGTGKITEEQRNDSDLDVFELRRPEWMDKKYWETMNHLLAQRLKTRPTLASRKGKEKVRHREAVRRIDCGRTTSWMPSVAPYAFMVDSNWEKTEAPKFANWKTVQGFPDSVSESLCLEMVGRA